MVPREGRGESDGIAPPVSSDSFRLFAYSRPWTPGETQDTTVPTWTFLPASPPRPADVPSFPGPHWCPRRPCPGSQISGGSEGHSPLHRLPKGEENRHVAWPYCVSHCAPLRLLPRTSTWVPTSLRSTDAEQRRRFIDLPGVVSEETELEATSVVSEVHAFAIYQLPSGPWAPVSQSRVSQTRGRLLSQVCGGLRRPSNYRSFSPECMGTCTGEIPTHPESKALSLTGAFADAVGDRARPWESSGQGRGEGGLPGRSGPACPRAERSRRPWQLCRFHSLGLQLQGPVQVPGTFETQVQGPG